MYTSIRTDQCAAFPDPFQRGVHRNPERMYALDGSGGTTAHSWCGAEEVSLVNPSVGLTRFEQHKKEKKQGFGHFGNLIFFTSCLTPFKNQIICGKLGSRCGEKVRDHVGQGYGKISQCLCTFVSCNAETPCPRAPCEVRVFECELSTYLACRIR